jgi:hypothetical protein
MEYPQVFICVDVETELPSIDVLEAWADYTEVHIGSSTDSSHPNIALINDVHKLINDTEASHVIAVSGFSVPHMMEIYFAEKIKNVYWIDSKEHLQRVKRIEVASVYVEQFRDRPIRS